MKRLYHGGHITVVHTGSQRGAPLAEDSGAISRITPGHIGSYSIPCRQPTFKHTGPRVELGPYIVPDASSIISKRKLGRLLFAFQYGSFIFVWLTGRIGGSVIIRRSVMTSFQYQTVNKQEQ